MGGVCLDDEKLGQMGFRIRPNYQNWTAGRLRREYNSNGGGIWVLSPKDLKVIRENVSYRIPV